MSHMRFPIKVHLAYSKEKNSRFQQAWNLTDKFFRLVQWMAFIAFVKYAADKSHSLILIILESCLELLLGWTLYLMIESKFEIRVSGVNDNLKLHRELFFFVGALSLAILFPLIHLFILRFVTIFIASTHV